MCLMYPSALRSRKSDPKRALRALFSTSEKRIVAWFLSCVIGDPLSRNRFGRSQLDDAQHDSEALDEVRNVRGIRPTPLPYTPRGGRAAPNRLRASRPIGP